MLNVYATLLLRLWRIMTIKNEAVVKTYKKNVKANIGTI